MRASANVYVRQLYHVSNVVVDGKVMSIIGMP